MLKQIGYMKNMEETNKTIDYYNSNAVQYFSNTLNVDMSECCDRFLKYIVPGGRIIDIGAGSGRDIKYFKDRGYVVEGIDASEEMCRLAANYSGVKVSCERIQDWHPQRKYDGIWANASLLHLKIDEVRAFFDQVVMALSERGVMYISLKSGILTGVDERGVFYFGYERDGVRKLVSDVDMYILDYWDSDDALDRVGTNWINIIISKQKML